ncbi:DUF1643 domain-containing protein [Stenotrophomonas maltophilia]|nr:DUF1643 domain-containing protein [Stenotrophomonas sp. ASS1]
MQINLFANSVERRSAVLSDCGYYRYSLEREWESSRKRVVFIGLNPSTADHLQDDATIRVCRNYSKRWGFGSMVMANLFAYRCTDPQGLLSAVDPVGPDADRWLNSQIATADLVVCCWTSLGKRLGREAAVLRLIEKPHCLTQLADGSPGHPLYKRRDLVPIPLDRSKLGF